MILMQETQESHCKCHFLCPLKERIIRGYPDKAHNYGYGLVQIRIAMVTGIIRILPIRVSPYMDGCKIKHQVFVLDEIPVEKQPQWDDQTNMFLGACQEHGHRVLLEFISEKELDIFCDAFDNSDIHAASSRKLQPCGWSGARLARHFQTVRM